MRFAIDPWDPSYGVANESGAGPDESEVVVDLETEVPLGEWAPRDPGRAVDQAGRPVAFIDGVRRVEARVWVEAPGNAISAGQMVPGVCASWAAGAVLCGGTTAVIHPEAVEIGRTMAAPVPAVHLRAVATRHARYEPVQAHGPAPEDLWFAVQQAMAHAEVRVAHEVRARAPGALVIVDGPLAQREHQTGIVGLVKTHHVAYLTGPASGTLALLGPGQRTPVFTIGGAFARHSWYVRLPGDLSALVPLAGVVRCECPVSVRGPELVALADSLAGLLPRYASSPYKDRRAPQNLTPIAGLERRLRHLLGDPAVLYRSLRSAAATNRA